MKMSMGVLGMRGNVHRMHDFLKDLLVQLVYNNIVWCGVTLCCKFTVPVNFSYTLKFKVLSLLENVSSTSKAPSNPFFFQVRNSELFTFTNVVC